MSCLRGHDTLLTGLVVLASFELTLVDWAEDCAMELVLVSETMGVEEVAGVEVATGVEISTGVVVSTGATSVLVGRTGETSAGGAAAAARINQHQTKVKFKYIHSHAQIPLA